jgi:hypothetical protein
VIRWMLTHIDVSRRAHWAVHHLTGAPSGRASPEACPPPPHTVWVSAGVPCLVAVGCGPTPTGDGGVPVVLAFQRVPYGASVSRREPGPTDRSRRSSARHRCPVAPLEALAHTRARRPPHKSAPCLWRVPYPLELCHTRHDTPGQPWHRGVGRNGAPLAPVVQWCFCDTSVQGRPRRNPTAGKVAMAKKLYCDRTSSMPAILQTLHIARATLYRWINAGGGNAER